VEDDLEEQVTELAGELRRRAALERVVDLVRLLEEVLPERLVGLLAVPRTAVGLPQSIADGRHGPQPTEGQLDRQWRDGHTRCEVAPGQRRHGRRPLGRERGVVRRIQAGEELQRRGLWVAVAARDRWQRLALAGHDDQEPRRLDRERR
jgi:hypothetical protein